MATALEVYTETTHCEFLLKSLGLAHRARWDRKAQEAWDQRNPGSNSGAVSSLELHKL